MRYEETRLRRWRRREGYSLQEVCDLTAISPAMLSRAERGLRSFSPQTRVRIARRLGVRVADLFDVEEIKEKAG